MTNGRSIRMRVIKFIPTLVFLLIGIQTFGQEDSKRNQWKTVEIETQILCNHFENCETGFTNIYYKIKDETKGVRKIQIDPQSQTITVKFKTDKTNLTEIEDAITLAGYKANNLPPKREAYNNLDDCCKGGNH